MPTTQATPRTPEPGEFRHGDWAGRCYRGGDMAGFARETCQVLMLGRVSVWIERTALGIGVRVSQGPCGVPSASEQMPAAALTGPDRGERLVATIQNAVARVMAGCAGNWSFPLEAADAEAFLVESDGLEPEVAR